MPSSSRSLVTYRWSRAGLPPKQSSAAAERQAGTRKVLISLAMRSGSSSGRKVWPPSSSTRRASGNVPASRRASDSLRTGHRWWSSPTAGTFCISANGPVNKPTGTLTPGQDGASGQRPGVGIHAQLSRLRRPHRQGLPARTALCRTTRHPIRSPGALSTAPNLRAVHGLRRAGWDAVLNKLAGVLAQDTPHSLSCRGAATRTIATCHPASRNITSAASYAAHGSRPNRHAAPRKNDS
jgi:hypothetical protein